MVSRAESEAEVLRSDQFAVRIADPVSQLEGVSGAAVRRSGQTDGEVGHQLHGIAPADPALRGQTVVGRVAREVWSWSARLMVVPVYEAVQTCFHSDGGLVAELLRRVGYVRLGQWYVAGLLLEAFDDEPPAESVGDHLR